MKAQNRDAEIVFLILVDFTVTALVGDHLAAPRKRGGRSVDFAALLFQFRTIALKPRSHGTKLVWSGHAAAAQDLDVIAAGVIVLAIIFPPRDVQVDGGGALVVVRG